MTAVVPAAEEFVQSIAAPNWVRSDGPVAGWVSFSTEWRGDQFLLRGFEPMGSATADQFLFIGQQGIVTGAGVQSAFGRLLGEHNRDVLPLQDQVESVLAGLATNCTRADWFMSVSESDGNALLTSFAARINDCEVFVERLGAEPDEAYAVTAMVSVGEGRYAIASEWSGDSGELFALISGLEPPRRDAVHFGQLRQLRPDQDMYFENRVATNLPRMLIDGQASPDGDWTEFIDISGSTVRVAVCDGFEVQVSLNPPRAQVVARRGETDVVTSPIVATMVSDLFGLKDRVAQPKLEAAGGEELPVFDSSVDEHRGCCPGH